MDRTRMHTIALACLALAGCGNHDIDDRVAPAATIQAGRSNTTTATDPGELRLPGALRLPGVDRVRRAESWNDRLSTLTHAQRSRLESLNTRYFGTLEFDTSEEQQALVEAGFPMPEEWLAADAMSDEELARLAKASSPKGSLFYANRELDRYVEARQRMTDAGVYREMDASVMRPKVEAMIYAGNALALTRSPFAAYLYGSINAQLFNDPAYTAAAISVAWSLGDERAGLMARQFSEQARYSKDGEPGLGSVAAAESLMWRHVHRYRPL